MTSFIPNFFQDNFLWSYYDLMRNILEFLNGIVIYSDSSAFFIVIVGLVS